MTAYTDGLAKFQSEAGGMAELLIVRPSDALDILADAMAGDRQAGSIFRALSEAARSVEAAPRKKPVLCSCCPRPLRGSDFTFGLVLPSRDNPSISLALGVCSRCAVKRDDVRVKATEALRRMWPELRTVTPTHTAGGRA